MARAKSNAKGKQTTVKSTAIQEFHGMLILAQWALSFFNDPFEKLQRLLNDKELEGLDSENGCTRFFHRMADETLFNLNRVDKSVFGEYDKNIIRHWQKITEKRNDSGSRVEMKYFQYLSLLVTELYLDWYFNRRDQLLLELNGQVSQYNGKVSKTRQLKPITEKDLNKIAFWEATGAGKTLLLHVNILQYRYYAEKADKKPDRIIVLTPNEGLSRQHVKELELSGFSAGFLQQDDLFTGIDTISVIDSHKLISDESSKKAGEKSFMAESFEGNNLVLVDEGHHGSSAENSEHRKTREMLCKDGFSFEYSATFGQAIARYDGLKELYAKSILFDYSYRYFHDDGYGKEAFILNLPDDKNNDQVFKYLCTNLLAFYQQRHLYDANTGVMQDFGIAKPLCVFVGNTVNTEQADVPRIIDFFADVLANPDAVKQVFSALIKDENVLNFNNTNPMKNRFAPLVGKSEEEVYNKMLQTIFNASSQARLKIQGESNGEITLSVGDQKPFCLINIGDSANFINNKLQTCEKYYVQKNQISQESYFTGIDSEESQISFLIGSRKFTEGWSSWRVSSMGLMNVGQNEGTQIIQLFGRGVRLRGRRFSLKRSTEFERLHEAKGCFLNLLETLQIFGIRAEYMKNFREYLEQEGIRTQDEVLQLDFKIRPNKYPKDLLVPQVIEEYKLTGMQGFKTKPVTLFDSLDETQVKKVVVKYDDYACIQLLQTPGQHAERADMQPSSVKLDKKGLNLLDWDKIYRILLDEKAVNHFSNLAIDKQKLIVFAQGKDDWYELSAHEEDVRFSSFKNLQNIERLFLILIRSYMVEYYKRCQALYEDKHREMKPITPDWIPEKYEFEIQNTDIGSIWKGNLEVLKALVEKEEIPFQEVNQWSENIGTSFIAIAFRQHLYTPLLFQDKKNDSLPFTYKPISLDAPSESKFVSDLMTFYNSEEGEKYFADRDLYLMRNASNRLKGIGFAQAGNFYPDFMLWIVDKNTNRQFLTFIDPKGLRNVPFDSPKLNFAMEIKNLQVQINKGKDKKDKVILNSVILSDTRLEDLETLFGHKENEYAAKNIFFLESKNYMEKLFAAARTE